MNQQSAFTFIDNFEKQIIEGREAFVCLVGECRTCLTDKSNAIRHLRRTHKQIFEEIKANKLNTNINKSIDRNLELRVKVDPNEILKACISLLTVHALPISAVEYPAFKILIRPYIESLETRGIKLIINQDKMKEHISTCAQKVKKFISDEMHGKLFCLLADIASRYNRSILGVNVAYMSDGKVIPRTIGMHVLRCSHTAFN